MSGRPRNNDHCGDACTDSKEKVKDCKGRERNLASAFIATGLVFGIWAATGESHSGMTKLEAK